MVEDPDEPPVVEKTAMSDDTICSLTAAVLFSWSLRIDRFRKLKRFVASFNLVSFATGLSTVAPSSRLNNQRRRRSNRHSNHISVPARRWAAARSSRRRCADVHGSRPAHSSLSKGSSRSTGRLTECAMFVRSRRSARRLLTCCDRSSMAFATTPLAVCVSSTADSTLLRFWPPGPESRR